jgi:hypothetical protein
MRPKGELSGESKSIEAQAYACTRVSKTHRIKEPFPAGMEPMGIERHRRSPQGERAGVSEWSQREAVRHRRSKAEVADRELGSSSQSIEPKLTYVPVESQHVKS